MNANTGAIQWKLKLGIEQRNSCPFYADGKLYVPILDDPQILKQRFKAYIFRLRRATRRDIIIFDEEYYRFNFSLDYEYDVENFTVHLSRANSSSHLEEKIAHIQAATAHRSGPYLQDIDATWAWPERERLERGRPDGAVDADAARRGISIYADVGYLAFDRA